MFIVNISSWDYNPFIWGRHLAGGTLRFSEFVDRCWEMVRQKNCGGAVPLLFRVDLG